jgi:hypothetical protein
MRTAYSVWRHHGNVFASDWDGDDIPGAGSDAAVFPGSLRGFKHLQFRDVLTTERLSDQQGSASLVLDTLRPRERHVALLCNPLSPAIARVGSRRVTHARLMPETSAKAKDRNSHQRMTTRQRIHRRRERLPSSLPQPGPQAGSNGDQCLTTPLHHILGLPQTLRQLQQWEVLGRLPFAKIMFTAPDQLTTRRNNILPPLLTARPDGRSIDANHSLTGTFGLCEVPTRQGFSGARAEKRSHAAVSLDAGIFLSKAKAGQHRRCCVV